MGRVTTTLQITNWVDEVLAERGFIAAEEVRTTTLADVLVETGASRLCLPKDVIQQLGLKKVREADVKTATGLHTLSVYEGIKLEVAGRDGRDDCVGLPAGEEPFLGLIPLEDLGLEPDLQKQTLRVLPNQGKDTYLMVL